MKILILEDSSERTLGFFRNLGEHDLCFVKTAQEAVNQLSDDDWDVIFLDHDLGGKIMQPSDENSGYGVACWLEKNPDRKPALIIVHSLNPVGAIKIWRALPGSHLLPGAWSMPEEMIFKHA